MKKTFLTILLCALGTYDAHGSAVDEKYLIDGAQNFIALNVSPWADPRMDEHKINQLALACTSEPHDRRIPEVLQGEEGCVLDPGYSSHAFYAPLVEALTFVRRTYEERRTLALANDPTLHGPALDKLCRVRIMDLGAGHGVDMWKFAVAGAHVTAVEPQRSLLSDKVNVLTDTLNKALPFLPMGVTKEDVSHFVGDEAAQTLVKEHFQNTFDGVYASQLFQCMSPREALECVALIPNVLKDNGYLWVRERGGFAYTGAGLDKAVYLEQLAQGKRFPGYMMRNTKPYYLPDDKAFPAFVPLDEEDDYLPRYRYSGAYVTGEVAYFTGVVLSNAKSVQLFVVKEPRMDPSYQHRADFAFDPQSLMTLLQGSPFDIQGLYWDDLVGMTIIQPDEMTYSDSGKAQLKQLYLRAVRQARSTSSRIVLPGKSS